MGTAANVRVGVTGGVFGAPTGTDLPTDNVEDLDGAFDDLGYVSEDGVTQSIASEVTTIKAWQNGDTVRKIETSHDVSYSLKFLETSDAVLAAYYGNSAAGVVEIRAGQGVRQAWVIEVEDDDDVIRIVIPDGQITAREDVQYVNGDAVMYGVSISCYPDADGVKAYLYNDASSGS